MFSDQLAIFGAVGLIGLNSFLLRLADELYFFNVCFVAVDKTIVALFVEGHFENEVEQEVVNFDISLLVVEFVNLKSKFVFSEGHFHFLPDLELSSQVDQHFYQEIYFI